MYVYNKYNNWENNERMWNLKSDDLKIILNKYSADFYFSFLLDILLHNYDLSTELHSLNSKIKQLYASLINDLEFRFL